jgi:prepilin-type processing-associated H-X9-DG protein
MRQIIQAVVVVSILATNAGLAVAGIILVRDTARRMECENNLKQIGIAVANYQDSNGGRYPAAGITDAESPPENSSFSVSMMLNGQMPPEKRFSWLVDVLPYVEQENLTSQLDKKQSWDAEVNRFAALLTYKTFNCPGYSEGPPVSTLCPSHYVGIAGAGADAAWLPPGDPHAGFFGYERTLSQKDIVRGNSETMVAVETSAAQGAWTAAGPPTVRGFDPAGAHFGGNHRGGCQAVFADGSVRLIGAKTTAAEWMRMVVLTADDTPRE